MGASLTESTLKTVPQVVNIMELKDKETPSPVSSSIRYNNNLRMGRFFSNISFYKISLATLFLPGFSHLQSS